MRAIVQEAFFDELEKIADLKSAGVLDFLGRGYKHIGGVLSGGKNALSSAAAKVSKSGEPVGHIGAMQRIYHRAAKAAPEGSSPTWAGIKGLAGSPYGEAAAAAATPLAIGYGAHKLLSPSRPRQY